MDAADVPRGYEAMRVFSAVAHHPDLMLSNRLEPGDLVGFDNRRVLHGRDAFDPGAGRRVLRGCYIDRDDVLSRLRVLRRDRRRPLAP
jgi:gamma-butyrobetaine dioxygenase